MAGGTRQGGSALSAPPVPHGSFEHINTRADALRAELHELRDVLAHGGDPLKVVPRATLVEANEQLLIAALRSQEIAAAAHRSLAEAAARAVPPEMRSPHFVRNLREANERLLMAALDSNEHEAQAKLIHRRHLAFIATVAHELRNPLLPLRLAVHMLDAAHGDKDQIGQLQATIGAQVAHIARLINDLLEGARAGTGKFRVERSSIDLLRIVRVALANSASVVKRRRLQLDESLPDGPLPVFGDPVRLAQVFGNLVENACKYTPEGGRITVRAQALQEQAVIVVEDTGIGITAAALPHIFDLFVQDDHAMEADEAGLGIGLAVVKELVEAHGGSVVASSGGRGMGSRFVVTLPLDMPSPPP